MHDPINIRNTEEFVGTNLKKAKSTVGWTVRNLQRIGKEK